MGKQILEMLERMDAKISGIETKISTIEEDVKELKLGQERIKRKLEVPMSK